jgi:hypothetical protein
MSDDVRLGLIIGGAIAVLVALLWRSLTLRRRRSRSARGLDAPDPQDRARAGIALVDQGLHRSARPVLGHVAGEQDDRVRYAIALAVARRQWEPVDTKAVRQVREWASQELEQHGEPVHGFGPAVTRLSDMGGPRPPAPTGAPAQAGAAPPSPPPASRPESPAASPPAAAPAPTPPPVATPAPAQRDGVSWHAPETSGSGSGTSGASE